MSVSAVLCCRRLISKTRIMYIHPSILRGVVHGLSRFGLLEQEGLRLAGLDNSQRPDGPEELLKGARIHAIMDRARQIDPNLGWQIGLTLEPAHLHIVGYLLLSCPDTLSAYRVIKKHFSLLTDVAHVRAMEEAEYFGWELNLNPDYHVRYPSSERQMTEFIMAAILNIVNTVAGREIKPISCRLPYADPDGSIKAHFEQTIGVAPEFQAAEAGLVYLTKDIDRSIPTHNPQLYKQFNAIADSMQDRSRIGIKEKITAVLITRTEREIPAITEVADQLHTTVRTLQRSLKREGTTYSQLVREWREGTARRYLSGSNMPIKQIAGLLGYEDTNSFIRAFGRWAGVSPTEYRDKARTTSA